MKTLDYKTIIQAFLDQQKPEKPITTRMVCDYIVEVSGIPQDKAKKTLNVTMGRLETQGVIKRVARGIYAKNVTTPFGEFSENNDALICQYLVEDGDAVIGYESGASLLNKMGLVSQMPKRVTITTNFYRRIIADGLNIDIRKPIVEITKDNYRYLQILDAIREMDDYPVDVENPYEVIRQCAMRLGLDTNRMILFARTYYKGRLLEKTVDIMLGDVTL